MNTTQRVQIPAYMDAWMRGDRYGNIVKVTKRKASISMGEKYGTEIEIAHVLLDKSNKVVRVQLDDCTMVEG
jgi:hypothetical protein